jgi:hypothetical protein
MFVQRRITQSFLRYIIIVFAAICSISLVLVWSGSSLLSNNHKMGIIHIVMFEFKSDATPDEVEIVSLINWLPDNGVIGID